MPSSQASLSCADEFEASAGAANVIAPTTASNSHGKPMPGSRRWCWKACCSMFPPCPKDPCEPLGVSSETESLNDQARKSQGRGAELQGPKLKDSTARQKGSTIMRRRLKADAKGINRGAGLPRR